ncbi:MAG: DUF423 domain-containing protein [Rhodanobacteraceae bacterium]|jgi:uncharacterized membrane protein YgdD (TMEM256/DUF423 family)|nr:DUF423 domain-containing protein [Rhodanobacteraceae bacterium]
MLKPTPTFPLLAAAFAGATAVLLGAFGAHALRGLLDEHALATWRTAVDYQFWHALALLGVGLLAQARSSRALSVATIAFVTGLLLFCGSLYALALGAPRGFGAITPLGGVAFITGWLALGVHVARR